MGNVPIEGKNLAVVDYGGHITRIDSFIWFNNKQELINEIEKMEELNHVDLYYDVKNVFTLGLGGFGTTEVEAEEHVSIPLNFFSYPWGMGGYSKLPDNYQDYIKESINNEGLKDLYYYIDDDIDIIFEDEITWMNRKYHTLLKNYNDVVQYNYRSDHWGTDSDYEEKALDLWNKIDYLIGDTFLIGDDDDKIKVKVLGIDIDKEKNGNLKIRVEEV